VSDSESDNSSSNSSSNSSNNSSNNNSNNNSTNSSNNNSNNSSSNKLNSIFIRYELILNLLRIKISMKKETKSLIFDFNIFLNNLLEKLISNNNNRICYNLDYIYFIKEIQLIYNNDFCLWLNKKYMSNCVLVFLQSYQNFLIKKNKNIDYELVNEIINILNILNCKVNELNLYNYNIPIYIPNFNLIIECISDKNTYEKSLIIVPYFLQRYSLFIKHNYKVLFLYKQLLPQDDKEKINYIKKCLYDIIKK
ncbi:conserved protein, unknown function, partial [Hepatocystis sp. ex Piliocolobus tephrosceles]